MAAKLQKGSPEPNRNKVAAVSWEQVQKIAEEKDDGFKCIYSWNLP